MVEFFLKFVVVIFFSIVTYVDCILFIKICLLFPDCSTTHHGGVGRGRRSNLDALMGFRELEPRNKNKQSQSFYVSYNYCLLQNTTFYSALPIVFLTLYCLFCQFFLKTLSFTWCQQWYFFFRGRIRLIHSQYCIWCNKSHFPS